VGGRRTFLGESPGKNIPRAEIKGENPEDPQLPSTERGNKQGEVQHSPQKGGPKKWGTLKATGKKRC